MAKKIKQQIPQMHPMPIVGMPGAINPFGMPFGLQVPSALETRKIVKATQHTSEFVLEDGTKLTIRPVLIDVKRAKDQWGTNGKPMYVMTVANITETESPPRLMAPRLTAASPKKSKKMKKSAKR